MRRVVSASPFLLAVALMLITHGTNAAVINALSASRADVGTAVAAASDGDTVNIPAGSAEWTTSLSITKAITLQGAGIGQTIVKDGVPYGASPQQMLQLILVANKLTRLTGIEFQAGARTTATLGGIIHTVGSNTNGSRVRIDHCKAVNLRSKFLYADDTLGVVDHNEINYNQPEGVAFIRHAAWNGSSYGDGSWAAPDMFGTDQFLFFEDNVLFNTDSTTHAATDSDGGGRYVGRFNVLTRCNWQSHGTESPGRIRGARAIEIYNNTFIGNNTSQIVTYFRSGVGLIHDNTVTDFSGSDTPFKLVNFRSSDSYTPFSAGGAEAGGADGGNRWDVNVPGGPFGNGIAASYSMGSQTSTVTVAGSPWGVDQWKGFSINRTSGKPVSSLTRSGTTVTVVCAAHGLAVGNYVSIRRADQLVYNDTTTVTSVIDPDRFTYTLRSGAGSPSSPATGAVIAFQGASFSEVSSNTANTITYKNAVFTGKPLRFSPGDTFEFCKVEHAMDQCGRMGGSLVTGNTPPIDPPTWNNQVTSPWYQWNNTRDGGFGIGFGPQHEVIRANVHFFDDTSKPGYTPFTYPHPLVTGSPTIANGPTPPQNLRLATP